MFSFKKTLFLIFTITILPSFLYSTIINIPVDYATIQEGIDASANTDTVLVQPGTYVEVIRFYGKLITLGSLFLTTDDPTYISSTIIDGNATSRVVSFLNGENSSAILTGFTITNGSTTYGGGVYCNGASPTLKNLIVTGNTCTTGGGGVSCYQCSPTLKNVEIAGNNANNWGGGIYCYGNCNLIIENVTISDNTATIGGGIWSHSSAPDFKNSILWNNSPQEVYIFSGSVTATYSDIEGGYTGTGNIDSDPLFVDPANGDYHLQSTSPCINTGDPTSPLDPDGTIVDMGAYYYHQNFGPVIHISTTGSDVTGNGSEEYPFATIQQGINVSANTDTVLVQPGTYVENINYNGKLITLGSLFLTTQDTSYISSTIIDGNNPALVCVVSFLNGENSSAILSGFTITSGSSNFGGGVYCNGSSPSLENLIITENQSYCAGGGICCISSNPTLENITISGNESFVFGGGVYINDNCNPIFKNVIISGNFVSDENWVAGCGVYINDNCNPIFENVTISGNFDSSSFLSDGGGIYCTFYCSPTLQNVIISGNENGGVYINDNCNPIFKNVIISGNEDGGIYCGQSSNPILENVTISGNSATANGGGIYCEENSNLVLKNSIMWNNSPNEIFSDSDSLVVTYSNIQGLWFGLGNIDSDPLFVDPTNGDYRLQAISPCIDVGDPATPLDPDSTRADMGVYYFHQIPIIAKFVSNLNNGYSPLSVDFTDLSTQAAGVIDEWYWDFGDGEYSNVQNPTHTFSDLGYYTISLTVTDANDSTDTEIKTNYIAVSANEQPSAPANVNISIIGNDVELSWNEVNTSIFGNFLLTDFYVVYNSLDPYSNFSFQDLIADTCYTHQSVSQFSDKMFYQVSSYVGDLRLLQSVITENPNFKLGELDLLIEKKRIRINKSSGNLNRN